MNSRVTTTDPAHPLSGHAPPTEPAPADALPESILPVSIRTLLTQERVRAGLAAARRRGRRGGRPPAVDAEKLESIVAALENGMSKAAVCRAFGLPRSTLIDTLARAGWTGRGNRE